MTTDILEWIVLAGRVAVVADDSARHCFLDIEGFEGEVLFCQPMTGPGSRGSSRGLLRGAIVLGLGGEPSEPQLVPPTLPRYVLDLIGSYHNAGRTTANYLNAGARFRSLGRPDIAAYLERHAKEEKGHEKLALRDMNALGFPGEHLVASITPPGVAPLCELFDSLAAADYPVGCIGYSYFFESAAAKRTRAHLDAWQALSPSGADVTRFMRAHSSVGSEADHVEDMLDFIAGLPADDRSQIARAVYDTASAVRYHSSGASPAASDSLWTEIQRIANAARVPA
jgi:hypothetical protein